MIGPWVLIIKDADDMSMRMDSNCLSAALKTCLPRSEQGFILFTTRNLQLATRLVGPDVITLSGVDEQLAIDMLRASLEQEDILNDHEGATRQLNILSFLPLAISQAAACINETGTSLATYLDFLQAQ